MIIPIDDSYRIAGTQHCWQLEKRRKRKGACSWEPFAYFQSVDAAVVHLGELLVRTSDARTLAEALVSVRHVSTTLSRALTPRVEREERL